MFLGNFDEAADARHVDHDRIKSLHVLRTFVEETQEGGGNEENGEGIDSVEIRPSLERLVVEQCLP